MKLNMSLNRRSFLQKTFGVVLGAIGLCKGNLLSHSGKGRESELYKLAVDAWEQCGALDPPNAHQTIEQFLTGVVLDLRLYGIALIWKVEPSWYPRSGCNLDEQGKCVWVWKGRELHLLNPGHTTPVPATKVYPNGYWRGSNSMLWVDGCSVYPAEQVHKVKDPKPRTRKEFGKCVYTFPKDSVWKFTRTEC